MESSDSHVGFSTILGMLRFPILLYFVSYVVKYFLNYYFTTACPYRILRACDNLPPGDLFPFQLL